MGILRKLTLKHLEKNKRRTLVSIIGIILSTAVLVGIGLLSSSLYDGLLEESIKNNGSYHFELKDMTYEQTKELEHLKDIESITYINDEGYSVLENKKDIVQIKAISQTYFDDIDLLEGRYPENNQEIIISQRNYENLKNQYNLDDKIELLVGSLYDEENDRYSRSDLLYIDNLDLRDAKIKPYKIVGVFKKTSNALNMTMIHSADYNRAYTGVDLNQNHVLNAFVTITDAAQAKTYGDDLASVFDVAVDYNYQYLAFFGVEAPYTGNFMKTINSLFVLFLAIVAIGCSLVIYNSFAISTLERKKQFGLYASIGTTKKQIRHSVYFEAFIVGTIGIIIGVLSAFVGIYTTLAVINKILKNRNSISINFSVNPFFLIVPIIMMVVVVMASAYFPAKKASEISPISAIRQTDEIKEDFDFKKRKFFNRNIHSHLAYRNMARNKSKYRVTIVSFVVSLVMFLSFSSLTKFLEVGERLVEQADTDLELTLVELSERNEKEIDHILADYEIKQENRFRFFYDTAALTEDSLPYEDYQNTFGFDKSLVNLQYLIFDDDAFMDISNQNQPLMLNKYMADLNVEGDAKLVEGNIFPQKQVQLSKIEFSKSFIKDKLLVTDELPFGVKSIVKNNNNFLTILMSESYAEKIQVPENETSKRISIQSEDYEVIHDRIQNEEFHDFFIKSDKIENEMLISVVNSIKILVYGFITLITLIGVTSVFNTLYTNIVLRKKEFAVLRSIGLDLKGFKKMLRYELFYVVLKAILYATPIVTLIIAYIYLSFETSISVTQVHLPTFAIIASIISVFAFVEIAVMYAVAAIKNENILESLRQENL